MKIIIIKFTQIITLAIVAIFLIFPLQSNAAYPIDNDELFFEINNYRQKADLAILNYNQTLEQAAEQKAECLFKNNQFEHTCGQYEFNYFIDKTDYEYKALGENLAKDFTTEEGVLKAWLKSPGHQRNLFNPDFNEVGLAVQVGIIDNKKTTLVVALFAKNKGLKYPYPKQKDAFPFAENVIIISGLVFLKIKSRNRHSHHLNR